MKIKKPVTGGIAKTPIVMQLESLECGAACLTMILAYYDKWIPLEQVRSDCGVCRDGSNARNIIKVARSYGFNAQGYRYEPDSIMKQGSFPCIIHWNFNHFVVLKGFNRKYAFINDPARGEVKVSLEEFDRAFTGICLCFEPTESFVPTGKKKSVWKYIGERSSGLGAAIAFAVLTTCITTLIGIIRPGFLRVLYDRLLTGQNPEWVSPFFIGLAAISFLQVLMEAIRGIYNQKINGKIAAVGSTAFMWKLLRLPMAFFSQRMAGDILMRQDSNAKIANTIVNTLAPLILNTVMMVFYFIVMLRYSVLLTVVALFSTVVNFIVSRFVSARRINAKRVSMVDEGKLNATTVAGIETIETIKASGSENGFFETWAGYQAAANWCNADFDRFSGYAGIIPSIVSELTSVSIIAIGLYLTLKGEFTLGMISAFQGYLSSFVAPADDLINASRTLLEMTAEIDRIDDVMRYPTDTVFDAVGEGEGFRKLSGAIEIKNVTFGYSKLAEPLISDFSLSIRPGSQVALVGASGSGKSTLSKLLSGLEKPWSGEILFDGLPISRIAREVFTGSLAVVDQDITIFEDTIRNNIRMWDSSIEDFEVILAARDARIHEDILQREGGYDYVLSEGGKDFSGGQKQRLEIARVLAQDPTICILDEATSALDAKTEGEIVEAVKARGITCIIIAHRLSTIRDCDEIIVLDRGAAVERGTHEELMALNGYYAQLITGE